MPDLTWLMGIGGGVAVGSVLVGLVLRRVLRTVYDSGTNRPNPPSAHGVNDRTPPGD